MPISAEQAAAQPSFLDLWWRHYGRHFDDPGRSTVPGTCKYCNTEGVMQKADPVCRKHFSYTSKKPMPADGKVSGVQPGHALILSEGRAIYFTNLARPAGCTAEMDNQMNWGRFRARFLIDQTWPTPFILAEPSRRHGDLFASSRATYSWRRVWSCGNRAETIDAVALRQCVLALGEDFPAQRLFTLAEDRWTLARGSSAGEEYSKARARVRALHEEFPASQEIFRFQKAWAVEPNTNTWNALRWALAAIQKQNQEKGE